MSPHFGLFVAVRVSFMEDKISRTRSVASKQIVSVISLEVTACLVCCEFCCHLGDIMKISSRVTIRPLFIVTSIYWFRNLIVWERNTSTPVGTTYKHAFLYGTRKPKNEINFYYEIKRVLCS